MAAHVHRSARAVEPVRGGWKVWTVDDGSGMESVRVRLELDGEGAGKGFCCPCRHTLRYAVRKGLPYLDLIRLVCRSRKDPCSVSGVLKEAVVDVVPGNLMGGRRLRKFWRCHHTTSKSSPPGDSQKQRAKKLRRVRYERPYEGHFAFVNRVSKVSYPSGADNQFWGTETRGLANARQGS